MKQVGGLFVPDIMNSCARYENGYLQIESVLKEHVRGKSAVVQAGGHIGIWPKALSAAFDAVYTFEPDIVNFGCLVRNATAANVFAMRAFLGQTAGPRQIRTNTKSTGGHSVGARDGTVPTLRIDDLGLRRCDAILLDLEGFEFYALVGALETITRCNPVIVAEENKKAYNQGIQPGVIALLLRSCGYKPPTIVGENLVFVP